MEFIPSLNQIWITSRGNSVIVFDLTFKAFTQREFKNRVVDIVSNYCSVLLVRKDKITRLMQGLFTDELFSTDANPVNWKLTAKTDTDFYNYLLKRVRIVYVQFDDTLGKADVIMAKGKIEIPIPPSTHKARELSEMATYIISDEKYPFPSETQFNTKWMVYRNRSFDMKMSGTNAPIMINRVDSDLVEVG